MKHIDIPYLTFMKHAEKVTKGVSGSRPMLKGVNHKSDGTLIVTDSYRLYVAKKGHTNETTSTINPKTGESIEGNFPDVSRLIPDKRNVKFIASLNVKHSLDALNVLLKGNQIYNKKDTRFTAEVTEDKELIFIVSNSFIDATYKTSKYITGDAQTMCIDTKYFIEALQLFKDAGIEEIDFRAYGELRPFTLTAGDNDELLALIMPVRNF
ncbi:hypothetical protein [Bacillus cereus]|uniref:hypothetical protein n=1 Tax=Bacillus cereus TaxID=1396 RepID=UPI003CF0D23B